MERNTDGAGEPRWRRPCHPTVGSRNRRRSSPVRAPESGGDRPKARSRGRESLTRGTERASALDARRGTRDGVRYRCTGGPDGRQGGGRRRRADRRDRRDLRWAGRPREQRGLSRGDVAAMATEEYETIQETNVDGVFYATRAAIPYVSEREGHLIFVGSFAGQYPRSFNPVYAASKWWVRGFAKSVAAQVGDEGSASPSSTPPRFARSSRRPTARRSRRPSRRVSERTRRGRRRHRLRRHARGLERERTRRQQAGQVRGQLLIADGPVERVSTGATCARERWARDDRRLSLQRGIGTRPTTERRPPSGDTTTSRVVYSANGTQRRGSGRRNRTRLFDRVIDGVGQPS